MVTRVPTSNHLIQNLHVSLSISISHPRDLVAAPTKFDQLARKKKRNREPRWMVMAAMCPRFNCSRAPTNVDKTETHKPYN